MGQSLVENYLHIIFSTKNRVPMIGPHVAPNLYRYITTICNNAGCAAINVGGYTDHIHILCKMSKKIAVVDFVKTLKQDSSKWIKTLDENLSHFYWQEGYGAFSVSNKEVETIRRYIDKQPIHHVRTDYKTELLTIFDEYKITYDERYLWD